eukprot:151804-Chlamydomonas_euryale.AAC.1
MHQSLLHVLDGGRGDDSWAQSRPESPCAPLIIHPQACKPLGVEAHTGARQHSAAAEGNRI